MRNKNVENQMVPRGDRAIARPTIITTPAPPMESEILITMKSHVSVSEKEEPVKKDDKRQSSRPQHQRSIEYIIEEEFSYKAKRRVVYKESHGGQQ